MDGDSCLLPGYTSLMFASRNSNPDVVQVLLAKGADVNAKDIVGWTALKNTKSPEVRNLLLQAGAEE